MVGTGEVGVVGGCIGTHENGQESWVCEGGVFAVYYLEEILGCGCACQDEGAGGVGWGWHGGGFDEWAQFSKTRV